MNLADAAPSADEPSVPASLADVSLSRPAIPARHFHWFFAAHAIAASVASFFLVLQNATDEPYRSFRGTDAFFQVGIGCTLIALWLYLIGGTIYGVVTGRLSRWWLLLLPWAALVLYYLSVCPEGFIEDIIKFAPKQ